VTLVAANVTNATIGDQTIPAANSKLVDFIKSNADQIKTQPSVDINYCLQQLTSAPFDSEFGPVIQAIIQAGCTNAQNCDPNSLNGIISQLKGNTDATTMEKIYILIGSMIGSTSGEAACDGITACEWVGGKIGATLTCLSISKEVFQGMETAIATLKGVTNQVGDVGQDAANAINNAASNAESGVQDAINQINKGATNDAIDSLKGVTDDVGQVFTTLGNDIANGLNAAGGAITGAGQQAVGAVENVGQQIANGFCGIFGC
jgi:hypothetical protein